MFGFGARLSSVLAMLGAAAMLAGCGSKMINRAPVEDRGAAVGRATPGVVVEPPSQAVKQPPGFENAGKPGYYTVKPGDTLIRIGLDHGQGVKDIARWSGVDNPNRIEVGQVLRVEPPLVSGVVTKPVTLANVTPIANVNAFLGGCRSRGKVNDSGNTMLSAKDVKPAVIQFPLQGIDIACIT